jgi:PAS domain-containing protein
MSREPECDLRSERLRARVQILEQLLLVYEETALGQADELQRRLRQLELQTTLLLSQGEATVDGVLSLSLDGRVLFVNSQFATMWCIDTPPIGGLFYGEMVDAVVSQLMDPGAVVKFLRSIEVDEIRTTEFELANGQTRACYTAPIRGPRGGLLGRLWSYRDDGPTARSGGR